MPVSLQEILRCGFAAYQRFCNPYIFERATLSREPMELVDTRNGALLDREGRAVEDLHGTQGLGHRHEAVTRAVAEYLATGIPSWYPSRVNPFSGRLAERLCERTGYSQVYFSCSGTEAVESAMKLARILTRKPRILSIDNAYHGCTLGSLGLMKKGGFRDPFGPHVPGVDSLPFGDLEALVTAFEDGDVAAVVVEPIQGEGGIRPQPDEYIALLCELTAKRGVLLVADEIQTGLGRSGHFLKSSTWPRRPDVALLAKSLGGGLIPISACLTHMELFQDAYGQQYESAEAHHSTFSNNAIGCVAALATLDIITDELIAEVAHKGDRFRANLRASVGSHPLVADIRGAGLMIGIELRGLDHPWLGFEDFGYPEYRSRISTGILVCSALYAAGFFAFVCGHDWSVLRIQPRLDIEDSILDRFTHSLSAELDRLYGLA